MSQDIVADGLNQIMNTKKAKKKELILKKHSKILKEILDLAKKEDYLDYSVEAKGLKVIIKNVNEIKAIKPRYTVQVKKINFYVRRFLPAKNFGFVVVSTSRGIMKHYDAESKNIGGCLLAYMY